MFTWFEDICRVILICTPCRTWILLCRTRLFSWSKSNFPCLLTFNFAPTDYAFISVIPDVFTISDFQEETLLMRIYLNRSTSPIFETTLYVYDNRAEIYDLRSVIEDYMEVHGLPYADCSIGLQVDRTDYYFLSLLPKGISSKLLSATIQCGTRSFSLFITDELPTLRLYYTNEYNYSDVFHLTAQTKRKLNFSRFTAICCGKSSSYDMTKRKWSLRAKRPLSLPQRLASSPPHSNRSPC